jgi:hypothetical protein
VDDDGAGVGRRARVTGVLLPDVPGDVFTTADALRHGLTRRQLEWAVSTGKLTRLRRGVHCRTAVWSAASREQRVVLRARALHLTKPGLVFSHGTAAALLGLPVGDASDTTLWVTGPPGCRTGREYGVRYQSAPLTEADLTEVDGLLCTAPTRTVVDCLRHLDPLHAVPIGDLALRRRQVTTAGLEGELAGRRWPRAAAATDLLSLLDGRRESPLESRSAVVLHRHGLPRPSVQVKVLDPQGRFVGRPDVLWLEHAVAGEADGLVKYDGGASVVAEERSRQAKFQALGLVVIRWTEQQLYGDPPLLVQQVRPALAAGDARRFRGRVA